MIAMVEFREACRKTIATLVAGAAGLAASGSAKAADDVIIKLKNEFIEQHKSRVTLQTTFSVDSAGPTHTISKGGNDGDMHFSGRAPEVQLPIVAEILNAKGQHDAVAAVKDAQGGDAIKLTGAWRIWCEHANTTKQVQGTTLQAFDTSNPDHVFELHPVTKVGNLDIRNSMKDIHGYQYKEAFEAFQHFENAKCKIVPGNGTTTIRTQGVGYNYVEFVLRSNEKIDQHHVVPGDGRMFKADILDTEGELVTRHIRMVFVEGTMAEKKARNVGKNARLHAIGIPRIDLALVAWRVQHKDDAEWKEFEPLDWNLPYEMIVVAAFDE